MEALAEEIGALNSDPARALEWPSVRVQLKDATPTTRLPMKYLPNSDCTVVDSAVRDVARSLCDFTQGRGEEPYAWLRRVTDRFGMPGAACSADEEAGGRIRAAMLVSLVQPVVLVLVLEGGRCVSAGLHRSPGAGAY